MAKLPEYFRVVVKAKGTEVELQDVSGHDFVEVVRCKDCREYNSTGYETAEFGYCRCLKQTVQDCFYCAHGERQKDENKEE